MDCVRLIFPLRAHRYKGTYSLLRKHCNDPEIHQLLTSAVPVDIKTAESSLATAAASSANSDPPTASSNNFRLPIAPELLSHTGQHPSMFSLPDLSVQGNGTSDGGATPQWAESPLDRSTHEQDELRSSADDSEGYVEMHETNGHGVV